MFLFTQINKRKSSQSYLEAKNLQSKFSIDWDRDLIFFKSLSEFKARLFIDIFQYWE
ncbi:hypothetical protein JBKA6_0161 [Ichthyobacterium seriolicida]|uniref:Uncharacterized protein n=1 Tax=Ichthyobacterium seriolicida TaxID=242600 RepID=A0A1J1E4C9_9FLAO|nr:hypothetical protein JBKA6_0161 [Ichthyobacterium seriolicida]